LIFCRVLVVLIAFPNRVVERRNIGDAVNFIKLLRILIRMIGILSASSRLKSKLRLHLSQKMRTTITTVIRSYQRHYESNRRICDGFLHEKFINIRHFSGGKSSDEKDVKTSPSTDLAKEEKKASAFVRYSSAVKSTLVSASNLVMNPKKTWNLIVETAQHYWYIYASYLQVLYPHSERSNKVNLRK